MRGLKLYCSKVTLQDRYVASFTDAWIETLKEYGGAFDIEVASFTDAWIETFVPRRLPYRTAVASFTDAWIETLAGA